MNFYDLYILKVFSHIEISEVDPLYCCFLLQWTKANETQQCLFPLVKDLFFHNYFGKKLSSSYLLFVIKDSFYRFFFCTAIFSGLQL